MLWYCAYTWLPATTAPQVRQRILEQHEAGTNQAEKIRGWYDLAGGGAGFLLIEADHPEEINQLVMPYMDLMDWDVRALITHEYDDTIARYRRMAAG